MNDAGEQAPAKIKPPRRRQQLTAILVSQIIKRTTPAPIEDVFQAIRDLVDSGLIDPDDGLIRLEYSTSKAMRSKKATAKLHEMGLGKTDIALLRDELGVVPRDRVKGEAGSDEDDEDSEAM